MIVSVAVPKVTRGLDDATATLGDLGIDEFASMSL
jgi:hypothetical protein